MVRWQDWKQCFGFRKTLRSKAVQENQCLEYLSKSHDHFLIVRRVGRRLRSKFQCSHVQDYLLIHFIFPLMCLKAVVFGKGAMADGYRSSGKNPDLVFLDVEFRRNRHGYFADFGTGASRSFLLRHITTMLYPQLNFQPLISPNLQHWRNKNAVEKVLRHSQTERLDQLWTENR